MRAAVVGQGYVGLVTAAGLAEWGHDVVGVEADHHRYAALAAGRVPIYEPGLDDLIAAHRATGRLRFVEEHGAAVSSAEVVFVAVGTTDQDGAWQTATMRACLGSIVPELADDAVLVLRSTLPPEFVRQLPAIVGSLRLAAGRQPIPVLLNPEFTREATAVSDFLEPDRVVIGVAADTTGLGVARLRRLYGRVSAPILVMGAVDACMAKLGANLFLATKISFANELAMLCDLYGASVDEVVGAMARDPRIGGSFLRSGVGFGGSCLPHQVTQTVGMVERLGHQAPLIAAVDQVNHRQRTALVARLRDLLDGSLEGARIGLLGLTFKPGTDDVRDAPAVTIARDLLESGAAVVAYDPMPRARLRVATAIPELEMATTPLEALEGADAAALVTEWPEFAHLDWAAIGPTMRRRIVIDGRNILPADELVRAGFTYAAFGRGVTVPTDVGPEEAVDGRGLGAIAIGGGFGRAAVALEQ